MMDNGKRPLGPERRSDYEPDTQPMTTEVPVEQPAQPVKTQKPRHKHGRAFSFVAILFLLSLLALGVMTFFWYGEYQKNVALEQQNLELLNDKLAREAKDELDKEKVDASLTEDEAILRAADLYRKADVYDQYDDFEPKIVNKTEDFALVTIGVGGVIIKKVDDTWIAITAANDVPETSIKAYDIPMDRLFPDAAPGEFE